MIDIGKTSHLTISLYLSRASWVTYWMKAGSCMSSSPGTERMSGGEFRTLTSTLVSATDTFSPRLFGATCRVEDYLRFNMNLIHLIYTDALHTSPLHLLTMVMRKMFSGMLLLLTA